MRQIVEFLMNSDQMDIGLAIVDSEAKILFLNTTMNTWYTVTSGEEFPEHSALQSIVGQVLQDKKNYSGVLVQERLDGKVRSMITYVYPQLKGECFVLMADIQDFQQYVKIQCEKERRETIVHMAAGTANIILNPLTVIKGTLQLLEKSLKDHVSVLQFAASPPHQKLAGYFKLLDEQIQTIDKALQRFLLFGKPFEWKFVPISLLSFMQEWIPDIQVQALEKTVRFALEFPEQNGFVFGHPKLLRAALQEIINNALDASPPGSVLTLRINITDNHIHIIVRDQGAGIPEDLQSRIILPFITSKQDAIGFGLSFSQVMIEKMGGSLKSDSSDLGTNVIVQLPAFKGTV
ncbi:ATP-binding protein [Brevibacillus borstelensis]|uniref:ATP-binding protein n=1 Tax=Brevibacillus borstelensis TaxID=45462 RepID=UPI00203E895B|nr:ATP-binding protein [Brevibacillus borstelensis]MCM3561512.1 ATP-binding protein [Brevibacillus borstelensis]MED1850844.1 ATP-binding protein [Brevibacillus borstelensis]